MQTVLLFSLFNVLGLAALISLLATFFIGKNSVWGTLAVGMAINLIIIVYQKIKGLGIDWRLCGQVLILSVLIGAAIESVGRLSKLRKQK